MDGYYALDDDQAYTNIRKIIHDRYGNSHRLSQAYQIKLSTWPKVSSNDYLALQRFADFLKTLQTAMISVSDLSYLNHAKENAKIKQLLPTWLKRKWNDHAIKYIRHQFPPFGEFVDFVSQYSDDLNHPIALEGEQNKQHSKL